ncbi:MAG: hypothetical protein V4687_10785 [Bacteroidota bacterium]
MKKLSNVSPFLLLLVPVFFMMAITFASATGTQNDEEVALKTAPSSKVALIKISNPFSK